MIRCCNEQISLSVYICRWIHVVLYQLTHVSHAPLSGPKARRQAGSKAWKNSSGWKKVARHQALTRRMKKMSRSGTGERRGLPLSEAEGARLWPAMVSW